MIAVAIASEALMAKLGKNTADLAKLADPRSIKMDDVLADGRDRVVDVYEWRKKHPKKTPMSPAYWGHYVAHDNNRDAMALTLNLSQNILNTYLGWKAQVLHDLHESGSFLYDNTIGNGPYNAWLDPILTNEWHLVGWNNVNKMTRMGMPGVYAWGTFDTWSPGYLMSWRPRTTASAASTRHSATAAAPIPKNVRCQPTKPHGPGFG